MDEDDYIAMVRQALHVIDMVDRSSATSTTSNDMDPSHWKLFVESALETLKALKRYTLNYGREIRNAHGGNVDSDASIDDLMEKIAKTVDIDSFKALAEQIFATHAAAFVHGNNAVANKLDVIITAFEELLSKKGWAL